jgi:hypothetical protein
VHDAARLQARIALAAVPGGRLKKLPRLIQACQLIQASIHLTRYSMIGSRQKFGTSAPSVKSNSGDVPRLAATTFNSKD